MTPEYKIKRAIWMLDNCIYNIETNDLASGDILRAFKGLKEFLESD